MSKGRSLLRIAVAYVVAVVVALAWLAWGPSTGRLWLDTLIADVLATLVIFEASRWHHNSSCYDAYWSVAPPLLATYWTLRAPGGIDGVRTALVLVVIVVWAVRLTANWVIGFPGLHHEDWRYPLLRERAGRAEWLVDLVAIHLIPTLQVFFAAIPAYVALTRPGESVGWLDWLAAAVCLGAVLLEHLADGQLRRFTSTAAQGEVMDRGVWSWSRHPNYFGEFSFWLGLALFGFAAAPGEWWIFVGAVVILALLQGASIPMMEQRSLERRPAYAEVVARVSRFVPRPPRRA